MTNILLVSRIWAGEDIMRICNRCVMDESDQSINFDSEGICNHCKQAELLIEKTKKYKENNEIKKLVDEIKKAGIGKKYDCIIGVSGGVDSTYVALKVKELGLRPLAVHFDNGWNSELAVKNVENTLKKMDIPLATYVVNWNEFKDLQMSFLKASVPDCEIPTDHAIVSLLYNEAKKNGVKYIIAGTNQATESIMPIEWSQGHSDWRYINGIHKIFGNKPLKTFPHRSFLSINIDMFVRRIKWISLLDYIDYDKEKALVQIENALGYVRYKHKHSESIYTRFYQGYILPVKFGYDKRKAHFSSLIMSGQLERQDALELLKQPIYDERELTEDKEFVKSKFSLNDNEFEAILNKYPKTFSDYPSYANSFFWNFAKQIYSKFLKKILNKGKN